MRYLKTTGRLRRGIASLELVLVFPMLLSFVAVLFAVGMADVVKIGVVTHAREATWKGRSKAPKGSPLDWISQDPMASKIDPMTQEPVSLGPLYPGQPPQAQSKNTLVANPWASDTIQFLPQNKNMYPHTTELTDLPLAKNQPLKDLLSVGFTVVADSCPNDNILP